MKIDNFMKRWLQNMRLDQYENGQVLGLIPWIESDDMLSIGFGNISAAGWSDACIIIPYHLYKQYEDIDFLKDNYEMMKSGLAMLRKDANPMWIVIQKNVKSIYGIWNFIMETG